MGAIIGALYACDYKYSDMLRECDKINFFKVFDINPLALASSHLVPGKATEKFLRKCTREKNFERLKKVKFSCIATDLKTGKEFEFTSGPIWQGVRASISIPMVFKPVELEDKLLIDGGVVNNVPASNLKKYEPDIIIACDVLSSYVYFEPKYWWDIIGLSMSLTQHINQHDKLKDYKYVIKPNTSMVTPFTPSLKSVDALIEEGYKAAVKVLKKLNIDLEKTEK